MMRFLVFIMLLVAADAVALPKVIFGGGSLDAPFEVGQVRTVVGPLLQLQTEDGTVLALQRGAKFVVTEGGALQLAAGNLRVGPAGLGDVMVELPQGPLKVAPLTAATITAGARQSTGRVYQGELMADARTFHHGEGFVMADGDVRGTFTPAAAQAPAVDGAPADLGAVEPAAGEDSVQAAPEAEGAPVLRVGTVVANQAAPALPPVVENPPVDEEPVVTPPAEEEPVTEEPPVDEPPVTEPGEDEPVVTPPDDEPVVDEPPVVEVPVPEVPTPVVRSGLMAAWSEVIPGLNMPNNKEAKAGEFTLERYESGKQALVDMTILGKANAMSQLQRGTAVEKEVASDGATAGLGRWVGGELVMVTPAGGSVPVGLEDGSLHYVWGEKATQIPVSGRVEYDLLAATQPTYTGAVGSGMKADGAVFDGHLAVDFHPGFSGSSGTYSLTGTVTMPQVEKTEDGTDVTRNMVYTLATPGIGVGFNGTHFGNSGALQVSAAADAAACPGGCAGTVNMGGFGAGMKDVGTLYAINPGADVGVAGAALFTAH